MRKLFILIALMLQLPIYANLVGTYGHVYAISEPDFLKFIYQKLEYLENTGQTAKMKDQFITRAKEHAVRPMPVKGLSTTDQPETWVYDASYTLQQDIKDEKGRVLVRKGATVDPVALTHGFHSELLFLNADDPRQLTWANEMINQSNALVKPILVQGDIKDAYDALSVRVYFDQKGILTKKFNLKHIPVRIYGDDNQIRIQEYVASQYQPYQQNKE